MQHGEQLLHVLLGQPLGIILQRAFTRHAHHLEVRASAEPPIERGSCECRAQGPVRLVGELFENGAAESLPAVANVPFHRVEMILASGARGLRFEALGAQTEEKLLNAAENQNAVDAFEKAFFLVVIPASVDHGKYWTKGLLNRYHSGVTIWATPSGGRSGRVRECGDEIPFQSEEAAERGRDS